MGGRLGLPIKRSPGIRGVIVQTLGGFRTWGMPPLLVGPTPPPVEFFCRGGARRATAIVVTTARASTVITIAVVNRVTTDTRHQKGRVVALRVTVDTPFCRIIICARVVIHPAQEFPVSPVRGGARGGGGGGNEHVPGGLLAASAGEAGRQLSRGSAARTGAA